MLAEKIRELREAMGLNAVKLANHIGVSKQSVSNWEHDNIMPSIEVLCRIANFFGVTTDYLLGRDDRTTLDVEGISPEEVAHVRMFIGDLRRSKGLQPSITPPPSKRSPR